MLRVNISIYKANALPRPSASCWPPPFTDRLGLVPRASLDPFQCGGWEGVSGTVCQPLLLHNRAEGPKRTSRLLGVGPQLCGPLDARSSRQVGPAAKRLDSPTYSRLVEALLGTP